MYSLYLSIETKEHENLLKVRCQIVDVKGRTRRCTYGCREVRFYTYKSELCKVKLKIVEVRSDRKQIKAMRWCLIART